MEDFGEKIGGARKDMYGSSHVDLASLDAVEKSELAKKDVLWPKPKEGEYVKEVGDVTLAWWKMNVRKALGAKPKGTDSVDGYIRTIEEIRDMVDAVKDKDDVSRFWGSVLDRFTVPPGRVKKEYSGAITGRKFARAGGMSYERAVKEAEEEGFGLGPKDKKIHQYVNTLVLVEAVGDRVATWGSYPWRVSDKALRSENFGNLEPGEGGFCFYDPRTDKVIGEFYDSKEEAKEHIKEWAGKELSANPKKATNRKESFAYKKISNARREGPQYLRRPAKAQDFLDLKIRGGEFGNWMSEKESQESLNKCYDSLHDLARVLGIEPEDVSLGQKLALAFGARGRGGKAAGAAHYEPAANVINITKMKGIGCLAHEWGHALDRTAGINFPGDRDCPHEVKGVMDTLKFKRTRPTTKEYIDSVYGRVCMKRLEGYANDLMKMWKIPSRPDLNEMPEGWTEAVEDYKKAVARCDGPAFDEVTDRFVSLAEKAGHPYSMNTVVLVGGMTKDMHRILNPPEKVEQTEYFKQSRAFGHVYSGGPGYWANDAELFARAFDCYVSDKLAEEGCVNDYLTSHANSFVYGRGEHAIRAYPVGEERKAINKAFDGLIEKLIDEGLLHKRESAPELVERKVKVESPMPTISFGEQMSLFDTMEYSEKQERDPVAIAASAAAAIGRDGGGERRQGSFVR